MPVTIEVIEQIYQEVFWQTVPECRVEPWYSQYLISGQPTRTETVRRLLLRFQIAGTRSG